MNQPLNTCDGLVAELEDGVRVATYVWGLDLSGTMQGAWVGCCLSPIVRPAAGRLRWMPSQTGVAMATEIMEFLQSLPLFWLIEEG